MSLQDATMTRMAQREITRRSIDTSRIDVRCSHGVIHVAGFVAKVHGHEVNLKHELEIVARSLRGRPGVRDVVIEVDLSGQEH
jgi:hypothetical protein